MKKRTKHSDSMSMGTLVGEEIVILRELIVGRHNEFEWDHEGEDEEDERLTITFTVAMSEREAEDFVAVLKKSVQWIQVEDGSLEPPDDDA